LTTVTDLQQLLTDLLKKRGGTKTALAQDLGISLERLLKVLKNPSESLGVPNLLRLAVVSGLSPGEVLTMAGKADVAELLALLYGKTPHRPTSVRDLWPTLSPKAQQALATFVEEIGTKRSVKKRRKSR
jgi:plasmid maintenance system antidote protein VapI